MLTLLSGHPDLFLLNMHNNCGNDIKSSWCYVESHCCCLNRDLILSGLAGYGHRDDPSQYMEHMNKT